MESWKEELYHHGIDGQKWGVENGPPYPLSYSAHSAKQKKLNKKSELDNYDDGKESKTTSSNTKSKGLETAGKILKGVGIAAGVAALAAGAYIAVKSYSPSKEVKKLVSDIVPEVANKVISDTEIDKAMLASINAVKGTQNCVHTSTSYIANRVLGLKTTAKNIGNMDEKSGALFYGRDTQILDAIFDGIKTTQIIPETTRAKLAYVNSGNIIHFGNVDKSIPKGSVGIIDILGHTLNYEKTSSGKLTIIDAQLNKILTPEEAYNLYKSQGAICKIYDCTNVSLKEGASDVLQYMVNM